VDERAWSRFEQLGRRRGREGGPATEVPHGAGRRHEAWARPAGDTPDRVPAGRNPDATRVGGALLFRQQRASTDRVDPSGRESEEARVARGPAREESAGLSPDEQYGFAFI
jgi:hypothetical protein